MVFHLLDSELSGYVSVTDAIYGVAGIVAAVVVLTRLSPGSRLDVFPTAGTNGWLGSRVAGFKNLVNFTDVIQEGYKKYKSVPFKVAERYHWLVVLSKQEHIEQIRGLPDDVFSISEATNERLCTYFTLGHQILDTPIHAGRVIPHLTRNLGTLYPEIRDEIIASFDEVLNLSGHEWKGVPALDVIRQVICRTSNRAFVGLPLCRDPDWIDLNIQYTIDVAKAGSMIALFPRLLRPLVAHFFTGIPRQGRACCLKCIGPLIEERLRCLHESGNECNRKPSDIVTWLIEEAKGPQLSVDVLAAHVLLVNFTAIHASSSSFTGALFYLVENPQYIQPLREEVEAIIVEEGWSKESVSKMHKVDSFLKECQRMGGLSPMSMARKAVKDFTFSDGTVIPKGTMVGIATRALQYDKEYYEDAEVFKPFRFIDKLGQDDGSAKNRFISTTAFEYLPFGTGRHACPGRYFAESELKTMLAHIVVTYDIKLENDATPPRPSFYGTAIMVDPHARILFRKRAD